MDAYEAAFWPDPSSDARPSVTLAAFARYSIDGSADLAAWETELLTSGTALGSKR